MKRRFGKKILSAVLAASMILGNAGTSQGLREVHAEEADIDSIISGKTEVTDEQINSLYRDMTYTPQAVHDPSVIKAGDAWYVFGSHRAMAKTSDLQNWQSVAIDRLFGDLDPNEAFVNSLYEGTIKIADGVQVTAQSLMKNGKVEQSEGNETEQEPEEDESGSENEPGSEEEPGSEDESGSEDGSGSEDESGPEDGSGSENGSGAEDGSGSEDVSGSENGLDSEGETGSENGSGSEGETGFENETGAGNETGSENETDADNGTSLEAEQGQMTESKAEYHLYVAVDEAAEKTEVEKPAAETETPETAGGGG